MREYIIADVFTNVPLEGNPVAVFSDGTGLSGEVMQRAARELNLSETVFLLPADADLVDDEPDPDPGPGADAHARARIFTPTAELPFAGHPVLGTAFILGQRLGVDTVRLLTGAGPITIALQREDDTIVFGEMEQPIPSRKPAESVQELLAALGVERSGLPVEVYDNGPRHVFVELPSGDAVAMLSPDMQALMALGNLGVSCFSVSGAHVKTRMFAPGMGVPEDPATGSAAGPLAVHLARHGRIGFGQRIDIRQGAEIGRPSRLEAVAEGSSERLERVAVGGSAVVVARGEYRLEPAG
jgi:trans-2,3-dihydro-3-hydroxyanthranilate isomerase